MFDKFVFIDVIGCCRLKIYDVQSLKKIHNTKYGKSSFCKNVPIFNLLKLTFHAVILMKYCTSFVIISYGTHSTLMRVRHVLFFTLELLKSKFYDPNQNWFRFYIISHQRIVLFLAGQWINGTWYIQCYKEKLPEALIS